MTDKALAREIVGPEPIEEDYTGLHRTNFQEDKNEWEKEFNRVLEILSRSVPSSESIEAVQEMAADFVEAIANTLLEAGYAPMDSVHILKLRERMIKCAAAILVKYNSTLRDSVSLAGTDKSINFTYWVEEDDALDKDYPPHVVMRSKEHEPVMARCWSRREANEIVTALRAFSQSPSLDHEAVALEFYNEIVACRIGGGSHPEYKDAWLTKITEFLTKHYPNALPTGLEELAKRAMKDFADKLPLQGKFSYGENGVEFELITNEQLRALPALPATPGLLKRLENLALELEGCGVDDDSLGLGAFAKEVRDIALELKASPDEIAQAIDDKIAWHEGACRNLLSNMAGEKERKLRQEFVRDLHHVKAILQGKE